MADQRLRDRTGNTIGFISTDNHGVQTLKNKQGNSIATYDPRTNITRTRDGNRVGTGNLLASLL